MPNFYDIVYSTLGVLGSPYWLLKPTLRRKVLKALRERMGEVPIRSGDAPAVLVHAVSLGDSPKLTAWTSTAGASPLRMGTSPMRSRSAFSTFRRSVGLSSQYGLPRTPSVLYTMS